MFACIATFALAAIPLDGGFAAAPAPANLAAASHEASVRQDALELAQLLNPTEPLIALAGKGFDQAFDKSLTSEGGANELETEHPGIVADLRSAIRDTATADFRADMPVLHRRYAAFFAETFTPQETAELIEFYRSPVGAKVIQAKFANLDVSGLTEKFAKDANAKMSVEDVNELRDNAEGGMWKDMSADDVQKIMLFGLKPVARKLSGATARMAEIETEMANEEDPVLDRAIGAATRKVYERYGIELGEGEGDR
jgi:hypothetical protein